MALTKANKESILKKFRRHDKDTSSPEVQIALITSKLEYLRDHFATAKKDHHSRLGLMKMVGRRKRLLKYLQDNDVLAYRKLIADLGLRK